MDHENIDIVVIGAGVVGLAIARALAQRGRQVVVFDAAPALGAGISSRNSGVLHSGLYYPNGSLKAIFCATGQRMLYEYAAAHGIQHKRCGKLVVATAPEHIGALHRLKNNAEKNGVKDLRLLSAAEAKKLEPNLSCLEALHSPASGLIDVHEYLSALHADLDAAGALIMLGTEIVSGAITANGFNLMTAGAQSIEVGCKILINAAGLGAQKFSSILRGFDSNTIPEQMLVKGNYFKLRGAPAPFQSLVYPLPNPGTSGLHARLDFDGQTVFGPDHQPIDAMEWDKIDYAVDEARTGMFETIIRGYWPGLPDHSLLPDYAGVRPKLRQHRDFVIQGSQQHSIRGYFALYGVDSPGLTSSLALGESLARMIAPESPDVSTPYDPVFPYRLC
jgi:L-2-hydroxyglutarate oxidase LhgO